jgi:hypothetical protein
VNVSYIRTGSKREKIEPFYSMAARIGHFGVRHPVMVREFPWGEKIACEKILLAQVRHDGGQKTVKSFRISSRNRGVYTTFSIQFEPLREAEAQLLE